MTCWIVDAAHASRAPWIWDVEPEADAAAAIAAALARIAQELPARIRRIESGEL